MLFLLCTAGVEIMRHSSVAARAPQQTHTVCIRYLRFCKGIGERCTQPDTNFDRVKPERSVDLILMLRVLCLQGCLCCTVTLHHPEILRGPLAFHLWLWLSRGGQGFGESVQKRVTDVRRDYNESCQLECSLVAIFFCSGKKKKNSDLWPAYSPNIWVTANYLAALLSTLSNGLWLDAIWRRLHRYSMEYKIKYNILAREA